MNSVKLKLEVNLYTERDYCAEIITDIYSVSFIFLDIDKEISENDYISYQAKNKFRIEYSNNLPHGFLKYDCINLPRPDKLGFELKRVFIKEEDRYAFVKKVFDALKMWSISMYNFNGHMYTNKTDFKTIDNLWIVEEKNNTFKKDNLLLEQNYNNIFS